jgi:hypothetical protein
LNSQLSFKSWRNIHGKTRLELPPAWLSKLRENARVSCPG